MFVQFQSRQRYRECHDHDVLVCGEASITFPRNLHKTLSFIRRIPRRWWIIYRLFRVPNSGTKLSIISQFFDLNVKQIADCKLDCWIFLKRNLNKILQLSININMDFERFYFYQERYPWFPRIPEDRSLIWSFTHWFGHPFSFLLQLQKVIDIPSKQSTLSRIGIISRDLVLLNFTHFRYAITFLDGFA